MGQCQCRDRGGMNADILNAPIIPSDFVACCASIASTRVEHANCFSPPVSHVSVDNQTAAKTWVPSPQINQLHPILSNQFPPQAPIALWTNCNVRFARTNESVFSFLGQPCGVQLKQLYQLYINSAIRSNNK